MVSAGGGAPSFGGDPMAALIGIALLAVAVFVVWKILS